jgi:hypothetical protein
VELAGVKVNIQTMNRESTLPNPALSLSRDAADLDLDSIHQTITERET